VPIGAIIGIAVGGAVLLIVILVLVLRPKKEKQRLCGGCRRVMAGGWDKCMFCGWQVPAPIPHLEFVGGPMAGQSVPLHEQVTTIGSVAGNTIVLADPAISKKHIGIRRVGADFELADLGSTNGVYVNGYRMPKKILANGDIVRIGNTELVFRVF